jgi:hypothetical protein
MLCCSVRNESDWKNGKTNRKREIKKEKENIKKISSVYNCDTGDMGSVPK